MASLLKQLWEDERGFVISAELVLVLTIGVLGMIVGISSVASSVNTELNDISSAFGALDQSYWYSGLVKVGHSGVSGSAYADGQDFGDCTSIVRTVPGAKRQLVPSPQGSPRPVPPVHSHAAPSPPPMPVPSKRDPIPDCPCPAPAPACEPAPCPAPCPPCEFAVHPGPQYAPPENFPYGVPYVVPRGSHPVPCPPSAKFHQHRVPPVKKKLPKPKLQKPKSKLRKPKFNKPFPPKKDGR